MKLNCDELMLKKEKSAFFVTFILRVESAVGSAFTYEVQGSTFSTKFHQLNVWVVRPKIPNCMISYWELRLVVPLQLTIDIPGQVQQRRGLTPSLRSWYQH